MSYRVLMVWAIKPLPAWPLHSAEARLIYEPKRAEVISKAYSNCVIPTTHGYTLTCF